MPRKSLGLNVGPYFFRQKWVSQKEIGDDAYAHTDFERSEIQLSNVSNHPRAVENLCHELAEIANEYYDLKLKHWKIQVLGMVFAQALKPLIKKWW
jgi:hypothetical protein